MRISKLYIILTLAAVFVSCNLRASSKIDTIYFQSGDRITAEVKLLENNQLKLSTDDVGTIYVEWDKVDSVMILNTQVAANHQGPHCVLHIVSANHIQRD